MKQVRAAEPRDPSSVCQSTPVGFPRAGLASEPIKIVQAPRMTMVDDPVMYNKPFTIKIPHDLQPDTDIFEMFCENEKDGVHLKKN
jgi:hypothetical protein